MQKVIKITIRTLKILLITLLCVILVFNVVSIVKRIANGDSMPTVFGFASARVISGSMEPTIMVDDIIVTLKLPSYKQHDIITFFDNVRGEYVTHRIIHVSPDGVFTTQGDANNTQDDFFVNQSAVKGKVVFVGRGMGKFVTFLQQPAGTFCVLAVGIVLWTVFSLAQILTEKRAKDDQNNHSAQQN